MPYCATVLSKSGCLAMTTIDWSAQNALSDEAEKTYSDNLMVLMKSMVKDLVDAGICTAVVIDPGDYDDIVGSIRVVGCGPAKHLYDMVDSDAHRIFDCIAYEYMLHHGADAITVTP